MHGLEPRIRELDYMSRLDQAQAQKIVEAMYVKNLFHYGKTRMTETVHSVSDTIVVQGPISVDSGNASKAAIATGALW